LISYILIWLSIQYTSVLEIRSRNRSFFVTGQAMLRKTTMLSTCCESVFYKKNNRAAR
jgi:hypothetical protein